MNKFVRSFALTTHLDNEKKEKRKEAAEKLEKKREKNRKREKEKGKDKEKKKEDKKPAFDAALHAMTMSILFIVCMVSALYSMAQVNKSEYFGRDGPAQNASNGFILLSHMIGYVLLSIVFCRKLNSGIRDALVMGEKKKKKDDEED